MPASGNMAQLLEFVIGKISNSVFSLIEEIHLSVTFVIRMVIVRLIKD